MNIFFILYDYLKRKYLKIFFIFTTVQEVTLHVLHLIYVLTMKPTSLHHDFASQVEKQIM